MRTSGPVLSIENKTMMTRLALHNPNRQLRPLVLNNQTGHSLSEDHWIPMYCPFVRWQSCEDDKPLLQRLDSLLDSQARKLIESLPPAEEALKNMKALLTKMHDRDLEFDSSIFRGLMVQAEIAENLIYIFECDLREMSNTAFAVAAISLSDSRYFSTHSGKPLNWTLPQHIPSPESIRAKAKEIFDSHIAKAQRPSG